MRSWLKLAEIEDALHPPEEASKSAPGPSNPSSTRRGS